MSQRLVVVFAIVLTAVTTGCPYEGVAPIGLPDQAQFDAQLVGEWQGTSLVNPGTLTTISARRLTGNEYAVAGDYWCPRGGRGYLTRVGDALFFNVRSLDNNKFKIARVELSGNTLQLRFLSEKLNRLGGNSDSLSSHVRRYLNSDSTYDSEVFSLQRTSKSTTETADAALRFGPTGCMFDEGAPLGPPEAGSLDTTVLGTWKFATDSSVMEIRQFNSDELLIRFGSGKDIAEFRGYFTRIGGVLLMNWHALPFGENKQFSVMRIEVVGDTLTMRFLNSSLDEAGASSASLRAAVTARLQDELIYYQVPYRFVRKK